MRVRHLLTLAGKGRNELNISLTSWPIISTYSNATSLKSSTSPIDQELNIEGAAVVPPSPGSTTVPLSPHLVNACSSEGECDTASILEGAGVLKRGFGVETELPSNCWGVSFADRPSMTRCFDVVLLCVRFMARRHLVVGRCSGCTGLPSVGAYRCTTSCTVFQVIFLNSSQPPALSMNVNVLRGTRTLLPKDYVADASK